MVTYTTAAIVKSRVKNISPTALTGTFTFAASTTVTGSGTLFFTELAVDDKIYNSTNDTESEGIPIASIESDTSLTLVTDYAGTAGSGKIAMITGFLSDADIEKNINQAESLIDCIMKATARGSTPDFVFDAAKHGILRNCATDFAAYLCVTYNVAQFVAIDDAEATLNALYTTYSALLCVLGDERVVTYLKNL